MAPTRSKDDQKLLGRLEASAETTVKTLDSHSKSLDAIDKTLCGINSTLVEIRANLALHIKRSDSLERQVNQAQEQLDIKHSDHEHELELRLKPLETKQQEDTWKKNFAQKSLKVLTSLMALAWVVEKMALKLMGAMNILIK